MIDMWLVAITGGFTLAVATLVVWIRDDRSRDACDRMANRLLKMLEKDLVLPDRFVVAVVLEDELRATIYGESPIRGAIPPFGVRVDEVLERAIVELLNRQPPEPSARLEFLRNLHSNPQRREAIRPKGRAFTVAVVGLLALVALLAAPTLPSLNVAFAAVTQGSGALQALLAFVTVGASTSLAAHRPDTAGDDT